MNKFRGTGADACRDQVDPDRTIVIPVQISGTLESSLEAKVSVTPVADTVADSGVGGLDWAADFTDTGRTCHLRSEDTAFGVGWSSVQPNSTRNLTAYLLVDRAISPNDSTGTDTANTVVVRPKVEINEDLVYSDDNTHPALTATGTRAMSCPGVAPQGADIAVVVDRGTSLADGCTDVTQ